MKGVHIYKLSQKIHFGKYRGKSIGFILNKDPQYILWANKVVSFFNINRKIKIVTKNKIRYKKFNINGKIIKMLK